MLGPYTTYQLMPIMRSSGNLYTYSIILILLRTFLPQIFSDPVDKRAKTNPLNQALNNQRIYFILRHSTNIGINV